MFVCGYNDHGQLGLGDTGDTTDRNTFTAVPALPDGKVAERAISGGYHTMILAEDGTVFACGWNNKGQLGLGDTTDRNTFTAVPFFGPDHPGLVPITGSGFHTFAAPAPTDQDAPAAAPTSPLQADLMALVDGNDDVLHCDVTLVGRDGVSVEAHRALLHARCPKLFFQQQHLSSSSSSSSSSSTTHSSKRSRLSPSGIASPMLSPPVKAGGNNDDNEGAASITVRNATGRALSGVVRFVYSDTLPAFDEMDEQKKKASSKSSRSSTSSSSSSSSSSSYSSEALPFGLDAAFELMVAARALSSADAPAMQHLQALCERHISKRLDLANVVPLLAKAVDAQYARLQRACHEYLAEKKPVTELAFAPKLLAALNGNNIALATAFSAAGGTLAPATSIYAPTEIPSQRLPDAMASLWRRADAAAAQQMHQQDDSSSSSSSSSSKSKKGKSKKKRSSDDAGNDDHDQASAPFGPDITVSIGSGEGATSLRADRFVLASRSDYFRACLRLGQSSFQEGAAGRVTLDVPSPQPSAAASRAVLEFLYTGSLSYGGNGGSASLSLSSSSSSTSLTPNDALDVLHVTGHSDEGGGYLQLRDNKKLRSQARSLIAAGLDDGSAFSLLRRSSAMNQEEAKGPIMEHLLKAGCGARPTDGQAAQDKTEEEEDGAWAPSEEWWSDKQEIAMCHEVIDELMSSR